MSARGFLCALLLTACASSWGSAFVLKVTDAATEKPLQGVEASASVDTLPVRAVTNAEGTCTIRLPDEGVKYGLTVTVTFEGYVPIILVWNAHSEEIPPEYSLKLEKGTVIGGIIQDEEGHPLENVAVRIFMRSDAGPNAQIAVTDHPVRTDAEGRWTCDLAPSTLKGVSLRVQRPGERAYQSFSFWDGSGEGLGKLRDQSAVIVLGKRIQVGGVVLDSSGEPAGKALLKLCVEGEDTKTARPVQADYAGRFTFGNCKAKPMTLVVQAKGCAPEQIPIDPADDKIRALSIRLSPGTRLSGRSVEGSGDAVAGAHVRVRSWRGLEDVLEWKCVSDGEGRFVWEDAPDDEIVLSVAARGFKVAERVPMTASEEEVTVPLEVALRVRGQVTSADGGGPIAAFVVVPGAEGPDGATRWMRREAVEGVDGTYAIALDGTWKSQRIRIEAPGFFPVSSGAFEAGSGEHVFDADLRKGEPVTGTVRSPEGDPLADVEVLRCTQSDFVHIREGKVINDFAGAHAATDAAGQFSFSPESDPARLVVLHDTGYAVAQREGPGPHDLQLIPWAAVEGTAWIGSEPATRRIVSLSREQFRLGDGPGPYFEYRDTTDGAGHYRFDHVVAGEASVRFDMSMGSAGTVFNPPRYIRVEPGETRQVDMGGKGRPLIGKVTSASGRDADFSVTRCMLNEAPARDGAADCPFELKPDGSFRVEDVPAGRYSLAVTVYSPGTEEQPPMPAGHLEKEIDVPDLAEAQGSGPVPYDLGTLELEEIRRLAVGDAMPPLATKSLDGEILRLSDYKGKVVLVHFWATWCAPCLGEMPNLKAVHDKFGKDERFAMIGLSIDEERAAPEKHIQEHGLDWVHACLGGPSSSSVLESFGVNGVPAILLMGPDGTLLANHLRGEEIAKAVEKALAAMPGQSH